MQAGGTTYMEYGARGSGGFVSSYGWVVAGETSCIATVTVSNGRVTGWSYKKNGGLLRREIMCTQLFSNC